ncbi:hypothetical protein CDD81_5230 [Ophiocordyceps australis]|uniref:Uncharacterized protein n=1 Tax=Ophiocordyceps australis TaxID=1399860 RepID=A0A2C5XMA0_9HYPO|nr:hypothetical protein CDD81_5230 [Ophiocordyceps australis]
MAWMAERIGEPILDGCIIATGISPPNMAISMQRWIGTCDLITGRCREKGAWDFASDVHKKLARYRYIPGPRAATSPLSYIKADRERGRHCENIGCYDEMKTVVSGNLTQECTSGIFNTTEDVTIKLATFPKGYHVKCGQWLDKDYNLNYYLHRRPCDCLTANGTKSRWDFTEEVLLEYKEPVVIDVFIHLIASGFASPLAKNYTDRAGMRSEFDNLVSFYNQTEKLHFRLKIIDITYNAAWSVGNDSDRMRQALYMGGRRDLNLYYLEVDDLDNMAIHDNKTTVFCTFPYSGWWALLSGSEPEYDGCMVAYGARMGTLATAMQHWFGVHMVVPSTCRENDCAPKFEPEDLDMLVASAALNRVVPYESAESRLRLAQALDI